MKFNTTIPVAVLLGLFATSSAIACPGHKSHTADNSGYIASLESKSQTQDQAADNMSMAEQKTDPGEKTDTEIRTVPTSGQTALPVK